MSSDDVFRRQSPSFIGEVHVREIAVHTHHDRMFVLLFLIRLFLQARVQPLEGATALLDRARSVRVFHAADLCEQRVEVTEVGVVAELLDQRLLEMLLDHRRQALAVERLEGRAR